MEQPIVSLVNISLLPAKRIALQERLVICLALVAGYIDATGLIKWKTYVSFMSGNTTQLGTAISADQWVAIITSTTVIGCFVLGIYVGTCLSLWKKLHMRTLSFLMVSGILILYTIADYYFNIDVIPAIAIIGFAMGLMNTLVTAVGNQKVNTDFVTGTLNSLARNIAMLSMTKNITERKQYKSNAIHLLFVWIGFLLGAAAAPFTLPFLGAWTLTIPAILLLICSLLISILNFNP
jgi:uncharacterized membrane protein YoaK (UPF0700 family)